MSKIRINNIDYPIISMSQYKEHGWDGGRECAHITLKMEYDNIVNLFQDNLQWSLIVVQEEPEVEREINMSKYCVSGKIIDNRDGSFTVWMGELTEIEKAVLDVLTNNFITSEEAADAYQEGVNAI